MIVEFIKYNLEKEKVSELRRMGLAKPMKKKLDIEILAKEQNYKSPTKESLDNIITAANIKEPIEDLLKMI